MSGARRRRMLGSVLALGLVSSVLVGCSEEAEVASAAITAAVSAPPVELDADAAQGVLRSPDEVVSAAQLRLMLEQLLGEHVFLIAGAASQHADGLPTEAALEIVAGNTDALTDAIALVYGDVGGRAFASLWSQHVAFFLDHARGTADDDHRTVDEASDHLTNYEQGFGSFTATATGGALPAEAVAQLLSVHVADINGYVAAHLGDDREAGAAILAAGHDYAADIGATLAGAIAGQGPTAFPGDTADERAEEAAELARAFANHLAVRAADAQLVAAEGPDGGSVTGMGEAGGAADDARARLDAAVRAAATDPAAAASSLERLLDGPTGLRADADALAAALGVPELGEHLVSLATAPTGEPTDARLIDAHRAAYTLAATWLG